MPPDPGLSLGDWFGVVAGIALFFLAAAQIKIHPRVAWLGLITSVIFLAALIAINYAPHTPTLKSEPESQKPPTPSGDPPSALPMDSQRDNADDTETVTLQSATKAQPRPEADRWWPAGTPSLSPDAPRTDDGLWRWARARPGSCEPLRQYIIRFPDGAHVDEANSRLSNERHDRQNRAVVTAKKLEPLGKRNDSLARTMTPESACLSIDGLFETTAMAKRCYGAALSDYVHSVKGVVISAEARVLSGSCKCDTQIFSSYYTCRYVLETTCHVRSWQKAHVEICALPHPS